MTACPCGGNVLRYGRRTISILELAESGVIRNKIEVNRYRCKACGSISRDGPPTMGNDVRDAIVMETLRDGVRPLVRRIGCDDRTIKKILTQWIAGKEAEHDIANHNTLGFLRIQDAARPTILIYDPEEEIVVDVIPEIETLDDWLREHASHLQTAVVDFDSQLVTRLQAFLPGIELTIPPTVTKQALTAAARTSIREIARKRTGNFRERDSLVDIADDELGTDDLEEIKLWAPSGKAIRRSLLHLMAGIRGDIPMREAISSVLTTLKSGAPSSGLTRLLETWKDAIVKGVHTPWIDTTWRQAQGILADVARWRPMALHEMIKGVLLFGRHHSLEMIPSLSPNHFTSGRSQISSRLLADAREDLNAIWQPPD